MGDYVARMFIYKQYRESVVGSWKLGVKSWVIKLPVLFHLTRPPFCGFLFAHRVERAEISAEDMAVVIIRWTRRNTHNLHSSFVALSSSVAPPPIYAIYAVCWSG